MASIASKRFVFCGPPGVGKGTQAVRAAERLGVPQISTGEMFRDVAAQDSELGRQMKVVLDSGDLVPDDLVIAVVRERLERDDCVAGCILDGFPRTVAQAEALDAMLAEQGSGLDAVIWIDAPEAALLARLLGRGRADDNAETIRQRLQVYASRTAALREHYRVAGLLQEIDGAGSIEEVAARVADALQ